jgi:hypothetical protein
MVQARLLAAGSAWSILHFMTSTRELKLINNKPTDEKIRLRGSCERSFKEKMSICSAFSG